MADSDCDEDDWESVWIEGRFDLDMGDRGDDLIKGDYNMMIIIVMTIAKIIHRAMFQ